MTAEQVDFFVDNGWSFYRSMVTAAVMAHNEDGTSTLYDNSPGPADLTYWAANGGSPTMLIDGVTYWQYQPFTFTDIESWLTARAIGMLFEAEVPVWVDWSVPFEDVFHNDRTLNGLYTDTRSLNTPPYNHTPANYWQPSAIGLQMDVADPVELYQQYFGAALETLEHEITVGGFTGEVAGYGFELGHDGACQWLHDYGTRPIIMQVSPSLWGAAYPYGAVDPLITDIGTRNYSDSHTNPADPKGLNWRASLLKDDDEIITLYLGRGTMPRADAALKYLYDNSKANGGTLPNLKLGAIYSIDSTTLQYWVDDWFQVPDAETPGALPIPEQWRRCEIQVNITKALIGKFSAFMLQAALSQDIQNFLDSLCLDEEGVTRHSWSMDQNGLMPYYSGASICSYEHAKIDSFTNTGNEIIIIKGVGDASMHDITVTSTDTLTSEDYTLALSPDRGTFIGPYPLDDYGALPTITYDNTNLYVSILKVEPTA